MPVFFPHSASTEANDHPPDMQRMSADILDDKSWLAQLVADKAHRERGGELPEIEIGYVRRAIEEIERLRAAGKSK